MLRLILLAASINVAFGAYKGSVTSGGIEYVYFNDGTDKTNWKAARDKCMTIYQTIGGQLAMLKTLTINNRVGTLLYDFGYPVTWVGAWDEHSEGYWTWIDNTPISETYSNWNPGEPSNSGIEDWMEINYQYDKGWNDKTWGALRGYLCQIPENNASPSDFSDLTFHEELATFSEAKKQCEKIGSRLVQVEDERSKLSILKRFQSSQKFWIDNLNREAGCSILGQDTMEEHDCAQEAFGFICETARPNFLKLSDEQPVVVESGDVEVKCRASGFPKPRVTWHYEDDERSLVPNQVDGEGHSTLVIKNASSADARSYICKAANVIDGKLDYTIGVAEVSVVSQEG